MTDVVRLGLTFDCRDARAQAAFWCLALDYEPSPPPRGCATWADWLHEHDVPESEWDVGAAIGPPHGAPGTAVSFLAVPEPKTTENRLHPDLHVSGGRHLDAATRTARIRLEVDELLAAGATTVTDVHHGARLDHVVLADPEGNEFCVV